MNKIRKIINAIWWGLNTLSLLVLIIPYLGLAAFGIDLFKYHMILLLKVEWFILTGKFL